MSKRPITLAPVSVAEGAYQYSDGGLSLEGYRRAQPKFLGQLFDDSPYEAGPYNEAFARSQQTKLADHKWLRVQINFYGIRLGRDGSASDPLTIPARDLRRALQTAVEDQDCEEPTPEIQRLEHKLKRRYRRAQIRQLEQSIDRFQLRSAGRRQLEQRLIDLQKTVMQERKQSDRDGINYVSSDSELDDPESIMAEPLQRPKKKQKRESELSSSARRSESNSRVISDHESELFVTPPPTRVMDLMSPDRLREDTPTPAAIYRPKRHIEANSSASLTPSVTVSDSPAFSEEFMGRCAWSQPRVSSQPTTISMRSTDSRTTAPPQMQQRRRSQERRAMPPPPKRVRGDGEEILPRDSPDIKIYKSVEVSPEIEIKKEFSQQARETKPIIEERETSFNRPSWVTLDSHTAEANHNATQFIAKHFLDRNGKPNRLKTLMPIVMHGILDLSWVKDNAQQAGLTTDTYYLGGDETRKANALLIIGWSKHLVGATKGMLSEIEHGG